MKKIIGVLLILIISLSVNVSAAKSGYIPLHSEKNVTTEQKTKRVNVVVNNGENIIEDALYGFITAASIDENSDFYIYTLHGNLPPVKIEHSSEVIDNIMQNYAKVYNSASESISDSDEPKQAEETEYEENETPEIKAYQKAFDDLVYDFNYSEKELVMVFGNGEYTGMFNDFLTVRSWHPDIKTTVYSEFTYKSIWENANVVKIRDFSSDYIIKQYISKNSYSEVPVGYFRYNKSEGTVTVEKGKADANVLIFAKSKKSDLLYIGGYMAPYSIYEENKTAKTIKGVSLGYNFVNIEKNASPKNVAWAVFSIDENVYDVNETAFVIPVKNAENVALYYKAEMGRGVCSKASKYQRSQDDKIKNLDAPEDTAASTNNEAKINLLMSKFGKENTFNKETSGDFLTAIKNILEFLFNIFMTFVALAWRLFRIALFVLVIVMIANKNIRKNVTSKVMNSKAGPYIEQLVFKIRTFWANITKTEPPIQGAAKEDKNFVFISHSSQDRKIPNNRIETVVRELEKRNIKCWISNKNIKTGQNYSSALAKAIENCSIFMVFLSDASAQSNEVGREMTLATSNKKEIIPVQIEDIDLVGKYSEWKYWLSTSQIKFLFNNNKKGIDELADEVEGIYKKYVPEYNNELVGTDTPTP